MKVKSESEVAQSCPTLHDSMDYSLPGSSIHGIFQARVLQWVAIAFSRRTFVGKVMSLLYHMLSTLVIAFLPSYALNMPANLENSAVATGLEKVSFHSNPKERQSQECSNY